MNGQYYVATTSQKRAAEWERIFGMDQLPILSADSRLQTVRDEVTMAYDLDINALHQGQVFRLASHVARRCRISYEVALNQVETAVSWPIEATEDTYITKAAESVRSIQPLPRFSFLPRFAG